jgi:hypothetical protein
LEVTPVLTRSIPGVKEVSMIRTKFSRLGVIGLSLAMALVVGETIEVATQGTPNGGKTLVGAWSNVVTPTSPNPPFVGLGTFSSDGTLTNISSLSLGTNYESPGHGLWVKTGTNTYAITFFTIASNAAGQHIFTFKVRSSVHLSVSGDEFTGDFQVDVYDASGVFLGSDTGTVTGTRIKVEPLP